ncbi:MAG: hypothetical protein U0795_05895 [Pirellulales bacterium]
MVGLREWTLWSPVFSLMVALVPCCMCACSKDDESQKLVKSIINCTPANVVKIVVRPYASNAAVYRQFDLVPKPIEIQSPAEIATICQALNQAKELWPNHQSPVWNATLEIVRKSGSVTLDVHHTVQPDNGTIIRIFRGGWNCGSFRSDSLGNVLEQLAKSPENDTSADSGGNTQTGVDGAVPSKADGR